MDFDWAFRMLMRAIWMGVFLILCLGIWVGVVGGALLMNGWLAP
jgi:hypothetical protein